MLLPGELFERARPHARRERLCGIEVLSFLTIKESGQVIFSVAQAARLFVARNKVAGEPPTLRRAGVYRGVLT